ncbi:HpcH/HpaI aldolase/citrate lyase family protein [Orrella sp. 11846]|uniref:HpcH/HpaI aldolase/citrate lyase family protein n=1 Tax=Orrella sp. 11846 TaxID=3409913 RepID=UPI003B598370
MRSLLFVPADSDRKLNKSLDTGSDVLIFDLEDAVSPARKEAGRQELVQFLNSETVLTRRAQPGQPQLYVRVNALDTGMTLQDLVAVMPCRPDGIVLPKCANAQDHNILSHYLDAFEAQFPDASRQAAQIIAIVTETAQSLAGLDTYAQASARLKGLMWGAEDLAGDIGALTNKEDDQRTWTSLFEFVRTRCLFAAAAAGVIAIDSVPTDIHNLEALEAETRQAYRDGFSAKAAIHPGQVATINQAMTPDEKTRHWATQVVAAFEESDTVGVATLDGKMLDTPHLRLARKVLAASALADRTAS